MSLLESNLKKVPDSQQMCQPTLPELFPVPHRLANSKGQCSNYFESLLSHIRDNPFLKELIDQRQTQELQKLNENMQKYQFIFYQHFLSVLVLWRTQPFARSKKTLVFLQEDHKKMMTIGTNCVQYIEAKSFNYFNLGESTTCVDLEQQKQNIQQALHQILQSESLKKKKKSPAMLKNVITKLPIIQEDKARIKKIQQTKPQVKFELKNYVFEDGNTHDYKNMLYPKIKYSLAYALLSFLIKDESLARVALFSFRAAFLKKQIQLKLNESRFNRAQIGTFKTCLKQLYVQYKKLLNDQVELKKDKVKEFFKECNAQVQKLIKLGYEVKTNKITTQQLKQSILKQLDSDRVVKINQIIDFKKVKHQYVATKGDIGFVQTVKLQKRQLLFSDLLKLKQALQKNLINGTQYWVWLVQYHFKDIAKNLKNKVFISQISNLQIRSRRQNYSSIHQLVLIYQSVMQDAKKNSNFTYHLKQQCYSHIYLIKYIAAAFCFQKYKMMHHKSSINVDQYACPLINLASLNELFTSMSYNMRRALYYLNNYRQQQKDSEIFCHLNSKRSYTPYFIKYFKSDEKYNQCLENKKRQLQQKLTMLQKTFDDFKKRYQPQLKKFNQINLQKQRNCQCNNNNYNRYSYSQCKTCQQWNKQNEIINRLKNQSFNHIEADLFTSNNLADQYLWICIQNFTMPQELCGLMKMLFEIQVSIINKDQNNDKGRSDYSNKKKYSQYNPLKFEYKVKNAQSNTLYTFYQEQPEQYVIYNEQISHSYHSQTQNQPINQQFFNPPASLFQNTSVFQQTLFQWMINKPTKTEKIREHQIYALFQQKKKCSFLEIKKMREQVYIDIGGLRVATYTQLPLLCEGILNRKIVVNTLDPHGITRYVVLSTAADFKAFSLCEQSLPEESDDQPQKYENQLESCQKLVYESIKELLQNYSSKWRYEDFYSLQVLGAVFSLFAKLIREQKLAANIAMMAFEEFVKLRKQDLTINQVSTKLKYLHMAKSIILCFSENICKHSDIGCRIFAKLMVIIRLNSKFYHSIQDDITEIQQLIKQYEHYLNKVIFENIHDCVEYFKQKPDYLTGVVKEVDQSISVKTVWKFMPQKNFVFIGKDRNQQYLVNLFTGAVLKNGSESNQLPIKVRRNRTVYSIFSTNSDMEIFVMNNGSVRTRNSFNQYFPQEKDTDIFFQFNFNNTQLNGQGQIKSLRIRTIFKNTLNGQEVSYLLIDPSIIQNCDMFVPESFRVQYYCWLQQRTNHLIFRKRWLRMMKNIGLVYLSSKNSSQARVQIFQGRLVTQQFINEPLSFILDYENSLLFQRFLIVPKNQRINTAIKVLSKIELPQFILQIFSPHSTSKIQFWLMRSNLKFAFSQDYGLISENYEGYAVAEEYSHHKLIPWSEIDKVNCLILKKMEGSYRMSTQNEYCFIVPHHQIQKNGSIKIPQQYYMKNPLIYYDIHDTFNDIRSKSRVGQLHMTALVGSFEGEISTGNLMISNEEYAVSLIRSCYNFSELLPQEENRVKNIYNLAIQLNYNILGLCTLVLQSISKQLTYIIPNKDGFIKERKRLTNSQIFLLPENQKKFIQTCSFDYLNRLQEDSITQINRLTEIQLYVLGLDPENLNLIVKKNKKQRWAKNQTLRIKLDQKHIKGIETVITSYNKALKDSNHLKKTIFKFFNKKQDVKQEVKMTRLNLIKAIGQDQMNKEMNDDLESSHQAFVRFNQKYQRVQLSEQKTIELLITFFTAPKQKCQKLKQDLGERIKNIFKLYEDHLEMIFRIKHRLTQKDFVECLYDDKKIKELFDDISQNDQKSLRDAIKYWILLTLEIQSFNRIIFLLKDPVIDKTALFRELQSPREQINKKNYWICFEAEMKIRIWKSQYDTYQHLKNKGVGSVSQLNMGEGKTQVIIPMLVLQSVCEDMIAKLTIPRINILSALLEEAQGNYFRFFSVTSFRIPCFSLKFNREIKLDVSNINRVKEVMSCLKKKGIMLLDRESCLSMILKVREEYLNDSNEAINDIGITRDQWIFDKTQIFDIFDEVDAMMTPTKTFVYSIGISQPLQGDFIRFEMGRIVMEVVCQELLDWLFEQKMITTEQNQKMTLELVDKGCYPKGLRLLSTITASQRLEFKKKIVDLLLHCQKYSISELSFYEYLNKDQKKILQRYFIDATAQNLDKIKAKLPEDMNAVYALRGIIGFGILQHCLSLRVGVDFGAPGEKHHKKVAVPYEAADVPSTRSEYAHPDLAIFVSYIAYFEKGLTKEQFQQTLNDLLSKTQSTQTYFFNKWLHTIKNEKHWPASVKQARQINMDSPSQIQQLYKVFGRCRSTVVYWLSNCIFPNDLKQYEQSISASSWDISYVENSIGFSGTKDNRWLLPQRLKWESSNNDTIHSTDGKMIHLLFNNTLSITQISEGEKSLWQRFVDDSLQLIDSGVRGIIDAGAFLAGKSLQDEVVPWICRHPLFIKSKKFKGITACSKNGVWKVYDCNTRSWIERGSSIPQRDTFLIWDEARTRGADLKALSDAKAVLSISPNMAKDRLMQAAGRLRMLGRCQQIYIKATPEILRCIGLKQNQSTKEQVRLLISWCCENSLNQNRKLLYPNSKLALNHYNTIFTGQPQISQFQTSLESMYSKAQTQESIYKLHMLSLTKVEEVVADHKEVQKLSQKMKIYGEKYYSKSNNLNDVCERQTQKEVQIQKIQQTQHEKLIPIQQSDKIDVYVGDLTSAKFKFDKKLQFSNNFFKCTQLNNKPFSLQSNQLCKINYAYIDKKRILVISLMEANKLLKEGIQNVGPHTLGKLEELISQNLLCRFGDLSIETPIIKKYGFEAALSHAQFFNGIETYNNSKHIFDLIFKWKKQKMMASKNKLNVSLNNLSISSIHENNSRTSNNNLKSSLFSIPISLFGTLPHDNKKKQFSDTTDVYDLVCYFLKLRNLVQSKFLNSDLQKVMVQLKNQPVERWLTQQIE